MSERRSRSVPKRKIPDSGGDQRKSVNFTGVEDVADSVSLPGIPSPSPSTPSRKRKTRMRSPSQIEQRNGIAPGSSSKGFLSKRGSLGFELSDRRLRSSFSFHGEVRQIDLEPFQDQKEAAEQKELELELIPFVIKVQRAFRMVKFVYKKFGPMLFLDSKMEASYGQIKFREGYEPAKWISFTPDASARRLVKMMDYYWELPKPEGPLHHRSAHAHTCPYVARRSSTPALLPQFS